jgi:hypothetical protein
MKRETQERETAEKKGENPIHGKEKNATKIQRICRDQRNEIQQKPVERQCNDTNK